MSHVCFMINTSGKLFTSRTIRKDDAKLHRFHEDYVKQTFAPRVSLNEMQISQ